MYRFSWTRKLQQKTLKRKNKNEERHNKRSTNRGEKYKNSERDHMEQGYARKKENEKTRTLKKKGEKRP